MVVCDLHQISQGSHTRTFLSISPINTHFHLTWANFLVIFSTSYSILSIFFEGRSQLQFLMTWPRKYNLPV